MNLVTIIGIPFRFIIAITVFFIIGIVVTLMILIFFPKDFFELKGAVKIVRHWIIFGDFSNYEPDPRISRD